MRAEEPLIQELKQAVPGKVFLAAIYARLGPDDGSASDNRPFLKEDPSWAIAKEAVFPTGKYPPELIAGRWSKAGAAPCPMDANSKICSRILHDRAPAKTDALALQRRRVEHGLLSVGLKIHCLGNGSQFSSLVERLGGASKVLEINMYKHSQASLCLVLPPVGNARAAILLLECIERFTGSALFANQKIQIQVCSPGRLDARRSAFLAIGFYLGSDTLRRYALGDLETTASRDWHYQRGQRLVIYDAGGDFERGFEWWEGPATASVLSCRQLPFENGR